MTDAEVIQAIRRNHLKANIADFEKAGFEPQWQKAWIDRGETWVFGPGPYVKLPCRKGYAQRVIRVYPPKRLRLKLRQQWGNYET